MDEKQSINSEEDASLEETLGASDTVQPEAEAPDQPDREPNFKESCQTIRARILGIEAGILMLKCHRDFEKEEGPAVGKHGEMKANIQLCFRHIEDARMRLGKAIQAYDGGVSVYPK